MAGLRNGGGGGGNDGDPGDSTLGALVKGGRVTLLKGLCAEEGERGEDRAEDRAEEGEEAVGE